MILFSNPKILDGGMDFWGAGEKEMMDGPSASQPGLARPVHDLLFARRENKMMDGPLGEPAGPRPSREGFFGSQARKIIDGEKSFPPPWHQEVARCWQCLRAETLIKPVIS